MAPLLALLTKVLSLMVSENWFVFIEKSGNCFSPTQWQLCYCFLADFSGNLIYLVLFLFISVYYFKCGNQTCDGRLDFDGTELTLLNMGFYLLSYEVLRDFMFHFLKGR